MTTAGTVIVGANQAGVQLASSLRDFGYDAPITMIGAEIHPPYQRPPLSKAYLKSEVQFDRMLLRANDFFDSKDISTIWGRRVIDASIDDGGGGRVCTEDGRSHAFEHLALTVGARVRRLPVAGADLDGVRYIRTLDDASGLREALVNADAMVVVGGGFIGLEAAAVGRAMDKTVTVLESADRLVGRVVAPMTSQFYLNAHQRRGVRVVLGAQISELYGAEGHVRGVVLADGTDIAADVVVIGIGVEPRTELAHALGLHIDGGIVVDRLAQTSKPAVVAAGDCTMQPHPLSGAGMVRLESVQNATSQAKIAARTLTGRPPGAPEVPWFWSDQYDLKLQIAGLAHGYDYVVRRGDLDTEAFSVLYYRDGTLIAVDAVNAGADYLAVRKALTTGMTIDPKAAADSSTSLRERITPRNPD